MEVSGTTALNITGKLLATGDWSNFVMGSGTSVTVTGGVDFYNSKTATNLDFNGGTLTTAYIYGNKYSNALPERNTNVNFNGTTVVATADNADFLQVHKDGSAGTRASAAIRAGGLIFDTNGHAVTIANVLANYTGGDRNADQEWRRHLDPLQREHLQRHDDHQWRHIGARWWLGHRGHRGRRPRGCFRCGPAIERQ